MAVPSHETVDYAPKVRVSVFCHKLDIYIFFLNTGILLDVFFLHVDVLMIWFVRWHVTRDMWLETCVSCDMQHMMFLFTKSARKVTKRAKRCKWLAEKWQKVQKFFKKDFILVVLLSAHTKRVGVYHMRNFFFWFSLNVGIGASIRTRQEIHCLMYEDIFSSLKAIYITLP